MFVLCRGLLCDGARLGSVVEVVFAVSEGKDGIEYEGKEYHT